MKLLVILASRGNPKGLLSTISSLIGLAGGKHEIVIKVGIDEDDASSLAYTPTIKNIYPDVQFITVTRKPTLGEVVNELARNENADVYVPLTDRMIVLSPLWDEIIANASMHFFNHILWWTMEQGTIMPIVTKKWYEAAGQVFTEYFPFWFDDTWIAEINGFVHGSAGFALPVMLWRKPGGITKRFHDIRFWMDFFIQTRRQRFAEASEIAAKLRLPPLVSNENVLNALSQRDEHWSRMWQAFEKEYGDPSEPDFTYQEAHRNAVAHLNPTEENQHRAIGGHGE